MKGALYSNHIAKPYNYKVQNTFCIKSVQTAIEENLDGQKKGLKGYFNAFFEFMAGTMSPMIPAFTAAKPVHKSRCNWF